MLLPMPFSATKRGAKASNGKVDGSSMSPMNDDVKTATPAVATPRDPNLSDRYPEHRPGHQGTGEPSTGRRLPTAGAA